MIEERRHPGHTAAGDGAERRDHDTPAPSGAASG
jgi:hypothetical protein